MTIKTATVRAFERHLNEGRSTWPPAIVDLGERALLTLKMIAGNSAATNEQIKQNCPATWAANVADIIAFHDALTQHQTNMQSHPMLHGGPSPCQESAGGVSP